MTTLNLKARKKRHFAQWPALGQLLALALFLNFQMPAATSQDRWSGSAFIEQPDSSFSVIIPATSKNLVEISKQLQPKSRKCKITENQATLAMTYLVYESAILGNRAFGRIRYNIVITEEEEGYHCSFQDFTFRKIERSPRYAKLVEVGGKPKDIATMKGSLSETQWSIIRWKTEGVINRKINTISSQSFQAMDME